MRIPAGLLIISGMVVCMYLFGLLVAYKHRQVNGFAQESNEADRKYTQHERTSAEQAAADETLLSATSEVILR